MSDTPIMRCLGMRVAVGGATATERDVSFGPLARAATFLWIRAAESEPAPEIIAEAATEV